MRAWLGTREVESLGANRTESRWSRGRRSRWLLALGSRRAGVLSAPVSRSLIAAEQPPTAQSGKVPLIYQKKRAFRIPFHISEQGAAGSRKFSSGSRRTLVFTGSLKPDDARSGAIHVPYVS